MLHFLAGLPITVLGLCLAVGFFLSSKRIWKGRLNATIVTILTAFALNLLLQSAGERLNIPDMLPSLFFALFSFAIGFGAGPSLRSGSGRSVGKQALLSLFYLVCVLGTSLCLGKILPLRSMGSAVGMLAGAQTQSSIIALDGVPAAQEGEKLLTYAVCYIVGTVVMILFVTKFAPWYLLKKDGRSPSGGALEEIVKQHSDSKANSASGAKEDSEYEELNPIHLRAYRVCEGAGIIGLSIDQAEKRGFDSSVPSSTASHKFEILTVFREKEGSTAPFVPSSGEKQDFQELRIEAGDVLLVSGKLPDIHDRQGDGIEEVYGEKYLPARLSSADILVTRHPDATAEKPFPDSPLDTAMRECMSRYGVVLGWIVQNGKRMKPTEQIKMGDILHVTGVKLHLENEDQNLLDTFIKQVGYPVESGADSRLWGMMLMVALAALISSLLPKLFGFGIGTGCVSMLLGLGLSWLREKYRHKSQLYNITYISPGGLSLTKALGLNLFIACKTLSAPMEFSLFGAVPWAVVCALLVAVIPLTLCLIVGKKWIKLENVALLSSLCGTGTCSSALQALNTKSGSSVFGAPYAVPYALGDIGLTLLGLLFIRWI